MKSISLILIFIIGSTVVENDPDLPRYALRKMNNSIESVWPDKTIDKKEIVTENFNYLYKLKSTGKDLGYLLIHQAPSRESQFDYMIIYNNDLIIEKAEILIYREDYGGEIGSKRWLKQFVGVSAKSDLVLYENIVGISGATISCKSATRAFKASTVKMVKLKEKGLI